jgi:hypothetical protein
LMDVFAAETSNNERINKTPEKMMAKMRLGYYPSNPHTGYKPSHEPGLHVPDEPELVCYEDKLHEDGRWRAYCI